jgi:hypothetical protein
MFDVYIQYASPTREQQKPILFDKASNIVDANALIEGFIAEHVKKSTLAEMKNTAIFIGRACNKCKAVYNPVSGSLGYCLACNNAMTEQHRENPDGGAYNEHQWT